MSKEGKTVIKPFNPLDKRNLGESVADALLETKAQPLPPESFIGAGVYALYYTGSFSAYAQLAEINRNEQFRCPIYVGKAIPAGARKGCIGRYNGMTPQWDCLHPGRVWAGRLKPCASTSEQLYERVEIYLRDFFTQRSEA